MTRVFASRYSDGLRPGNGALICWQPGETVTIISGQDAGREFVITSEGRSHAAAPAGQFVREGYFADDPGRTPWAKLESQLWFSEDGGRMTTLSNDSEGGTHGTWVTCGPVFALHDSAPGAHGRYARFAVPPAGAIQITRDIWYDGITPQQVSAYVTEGGRWEHQDGSPCPAGLNIPAGEWTQVMIPFRCADGLVIRHAAGAATPFWLDDLPVSETGWLGPGGEGPP